MPDTQKTEKLAQLARQLPPTPETILLTEGEMLPNAVYWRKLH